jgi:hypothetical protein
MVAHPHDAALHAAASQELRIGLRSAINALQASCKGDDCEELGSLKDSYGQLLAENVRLQADAARYRSVAAMVGILRQLGGMLPSTHQVVMAVVDAADAAMALDKPKS